MRKNSDRNSGEISQGVKTKASNSPIMEFISNREVMIEGVNGILEYDDSVVRLNSGRLIITFLGKQMSIKCLTASSLVITGCFTTVEFMS